MQEFSPSFFASTPASVKKKSSKTTPPVSKDDLLDGYIPAREFSPLDLDMDMLLVNTPPTDINPQLLQIQLKNYSGLPAGRQKSDPATISDILQSRQRSVSDPYKQSSTPTRGRHDRQLPVSSTTSSPAARESTFVQKNPKKAKFLERNRIAAAKCRTKKKQWIENLESAARQGQLQLRELQGLVVTLQQECSLLRHRLDSCQCQFTDVTATYAMPAPQQAFFYAQT